MPGDEGESSQDPHLVISSFSARSPFLSTKLSTGIGHKVAYYFSLYESFP
jgi:hypothetical protein